MTHATILHLVWACQGWQVIMVRPFHRINHSPVLTSDPYKNSFIFQFLLRQFHPLPQTLPRLSKGKVGEVLEGDLEVACMHGHCSNSRGRL